MNGFNMDLGFGAALVDYARIGLWEWDLPSGRVAYNTYFEEMAGRGPLSPGIAARSALIYPDDAAFVQDGLDACADGYTEGSTKRFRLVRGDGSLLWVAEYCAVARRGADGAPLSITGMVFDISETKNAEARLKVEIAQREYVAQLAGLCSWEWDPVRHVFYFNEDYFKLFGLEEAEQDGSDKVLRQLMHPDDFDTLMAGVRAFADKGEGTYRQEIRMRARQGGYVWLLDIASIAERDVDGRPTLLRGGVLNIDEQVRARRQLRTALEEKEAFNEALQERVAEAVEDLEEARRTSLAMVEASPHLNIVFNDQFDVIDCNPGVAGYFGFDTKQEVIDNFKAIVASATPEIQPDGRRSIHLSERLVAAAETGADEVETEFNWKGAKIPMHIVFRRIPYEDSFAIVAYGVDLTNLRRAQDALVKQDKLLHSVNTAATRLLSAQPDTFATTVWECLQVIAQSAGVDRIHLWQNYEKDGDARFRRIASWVEGESEEQANADTRTISYDDAPYWRTELGAGRVINVLTADLPEEERSALAPRGVLSTLRIPIDYYGDFWGFVALDDTKEAEVFNERTITILRSAGILIFAAVVRNQMTESLLGAQKGLLERDKLLQAVNGAAALLMGGDAEENIEGPVHDALKILGESVEADRAYVWVNSMEDGQLCCSQAVEWARDEVEASHSGAPAEKIPYDLFIPNWREILDSENSLSLLAETMDEALAGFPGMEDVKSLLILPIVLQGEFWGFVGFDDTTRARAFTDTQASIMKSGGMLIASAMVRGQMTENLIAAREEALAGMNAKTEFLSRMSHEIRTPMNAIIGMTAIARKTDDLERIQHCLDKIDVSSRQLLGIINDVLDMSKIEANKLEINETEFDFEAMMQNVFNVIQVKLEEKHQQFTFNFEHAFTRNMVSDELRLSQVLINLLTNAVKFTPDHGKITLRVREGRGSTRSAQQSEPAAEGEFARTARSGSSGGLQAAPSRTLVSSLSDESEAAAAGLDNGRSILHVEVVDSGIGIAADRVGKLFQSFTQADGSVTRQYGGTGLGLAISKRIVNLMDGDIWVESTEGEGSSFIFEVNVGWGGPRTSGVALQKPRGDLRILVVDDSEDTLDYFQNILQSFSLQCDVAQSGEESVEMAQAAADEGRPYDLVFMDWNLPGMNGGQAGQAIEQLGGEAVVVMISAADWADIEPEASALGLSNFLPKPVLPSSLYNSIVQFTQHTMAPPQSQQAELPHKDWSSRRLLLVEDIEINREIVLSILEETGVSIDTAENGEEAVSAFMAAPQKYDLIMMDVQMPVLDGLGATQKIRGLDLPRAKTIPIIAMTANAFKEDEKDCLAAGMNGHVAKPLEMDELFGTLSHYLD